MSLPAATSCATYMTQTGHGSPDVEWSVFSLNFLTLNRSSPRKFTLIKAIL